MTKQAHVCAESKSCCCSMSALEPDDDCPIHGYPYPPRCGECGKFLPRPRQETTSAEAEE